MRTRLARSPASKTEKEPPASVSSFSAQSAGRSHGSPAQHAAFDFGRVSVLDQTLGSAGASELPHRTEMESAFGEGFSAVRAFTGRAAELDRFGAAAAATSIAKSAPTWWGGLSAADKGNWIKRGNKAVDTVVKHAKAKHPELKITAANFNLDFPKTQARGLNVVAAGSPALIGKTFVQSVELNPAYVMDVVVHEIFGHPEYGTYGTEYHLALYDQATAKVGGYVKPAAGSPDRTTELDAYAYQETEIYAVLRSSSYRTAPTAKDAPKVPNLDTQTLVDWHVGLIKKQWAPTAVVAILGGLRKRLRVDPRITQAALTMFDIAVLNNFDAKTQAAVWTK
jgi:hypothetical protein